MGLFDFFRDWWDSIFTRDVSMAVLGTEQSGKTTWYNYLLNKEIKQGSTKGTAVSREIEEFRTRDAKGHLFTLKKSNDISGALEYVGNFYKDMVLENDIILFFFRAPEFYLNVNNARHDIILRLGVIKDYSMKKKEQNPQKWEREHIFLIPTFKDKAEEIGLSLDMLKTELYKALLSDPKTESFALDIKVLRMYTTTDNRDLAFLKRTVFSKSLK